MKQRIISLLFGSGLLLGLLVLAGWFVQPAQAESAYQNSACVEILTDAANRAGIVAEDTEWYSDKSGPEWDCYVHYGWGIVWGAQFRIQAIGWTGVPFSCTDEYCEETTFHGYPAILEKQACSRNVSWYVMRGGVGYLLTAQKSNTCENVQPGEVMAFAEALWSAAEPALPGDDLTPNPGDQPGEDVPIVPTEPTGRDPAGSLGPLATNPLIPLAGALIGSVIGWLVSVAVTSGNVLKSLLVPAFRPAQSVPIAASSKPAVSPADVSKSGSEYLWDLSTNLVGSSSTVIGALSEFFDFKEDAKTLQKLHTSLRAWQNNPTKGAAEAYLKNLRNVTNVRLANASKALGNAANVLDGVDALAKGLEKASERGYIGSDKVLAVGAEVSKKALNYALTKNPVAGLVNSALGGVTEMVYGKDGRIDIGSIIDKGADAWDTTTQEYAGYTGGDWFAPKNADFGDVLAKDPELQRKDQYLHGVRQVKKLVDQGEITLQEGGARIRSLRDTILGGE